ncbi:hypothetical protein N9341_03865 [Candidatus Pelagibacter sp.]|nr:hypothetical protein [Candidatus Pelagibacter sp.]
MLLKFVKIIFFCISFTFLTGFLPFLSLIGPGLTVVSSGNIAQAGVQYILNESIKEKTGKDSLAFFKDEIDKKNNKKDFNIELRNLVEKRIKLVRKKMNVKKINR